MLNLSFRQSLEQYWPFCSALRDNKKISSFFYNISIDIYSKLISCNFYLSIPLFYFYRESEVFPLEVKERIRYFREKKGMTVNKLANEAGVSQSFLRDIELGNKKPTVETLSALCWPLSITLKEFFDDGSPSPRSEDGLEEIIYKLSPEQRKRLADFLNSIIK